MSSRRRSSCFSFLLLHRRHRLVFEELGFVRGFDWNRGEKLGQGPRFCTLKGSRWALGRHASREIPAVFFIFIFFISGFYKNIFSIWKFTEIYPTWPPGCRAAGAYLQKKKTKKLQTGPGDRSPGSRAAGLPGRPAAVRPAFFFCNLAFFTK